MEQYVIKGGNPLVGEVEIGGAKNAALAIISAAVMTDETVTIENLPNVRDINVLLNAISDIGAKVDRLDAHTVKMNGSFIHNLVVDNEYIRKIRASYYLLGALLGKYKHAEVALPGGCDIGSRPFDLHLKGFRALGATVDIRHGLVVADAKQLKGTHIYLDKVSVGATINIMMAAAMAEGKTTLENAAKEPHVVDAANFLNSMGANIRGAGTDVIRIVGVEKLHKTEYSIIPDQIEAGTFMLAAEYNLTDIGKYGRMWLRYMIENKPSEYRHMARMGQLRKQAEAVNEEAYERLDNIEAAWLKKHMTGKRKTFMEQLYLRNQARAMAEEIVINEIVFKCR